jgi:hypothetical protein
MIKEALVDSLTLMHARYSIIRETKTKVALWFGILTLATAVIGASFTGQFIKIISQSDAPNSEAAKVFATTYLQSYLRGELGSLVATTLGLALVSVIIAPFTGTSITSLVSHHHLVSMRSSNRHRFTDSLITQFFASISLLQLLTLTAVGSLLTLDKGRIEGILYTWASWPVLVMISTMFVWIAEYLYRKLGERKRLAILLVTLATIGTVVLVNPEQGKTVFGIGTAYASIIQGFSEFDIQIKLLAVIILIALFFLFFFISYKISQSALAQPEIFAKDNTTLKKVRSRTTSSYSSIELGYLGLNQLWRNLEIRKPLGMATFFGAAVVFFGNQTFSVMSTMVLIIPLIVCLSWGSNIFGILGNGFTWLASKPFAIRNLLWVFAGIQVFLTISLFVVMCLPSLLTGRIAQESAAGIILAVISTSVLMTRSAIHKSVHYPYPYKAGIRGEAILPPATLINYTLRFSLWSGIYGFIVVGSGNILTQLGLAFLAIMWSCFRMARLNRKFNRDAAIKNKIIYTVAND